MKSLGVFFKKHSFKDDYVEIFISEHSNTFYAYYKGDRYKIVDREIINVSKEVTTNNLYSFFDGVEEEINKQKRLIKLKKII